MEDVLIPYQGWGSEITNLLSCAENPGKWEINVVYPALAPEKWVKGRVAILGDAVSVDVLPELLLLKESRPMRCFHISAQARDRVSKTHTFLPSSLVIHRRLSRMLQYASSTLLRSPFATLSSFQEVLRVYAAVRQPRAQKIWEGSRRTGDMLEGKAHGIQVAELQDMWNFVWNQPQDFEFRKATAILQKEGFFMKASL